MGNQVIDIGVLGWQRDDSYFPEDLPPDWHLAYYANEHDSAWVPAETWLGADLPETSGWREDVGEAFRFVAVLDERHLDVAEPEAIGRALASLDEQLVAVIGADAVCAQVLGNSAFVSGVPRIGPQEVWSPVDNPAGGVLVGQVDAAQLDSPRAMRAVLEGFAGAGVEGRLFLGVNAPIGLIDDLRTLGRLMGLC